MVMDISEDAAENQGSRQRYLLMGEPEQPLAAFVDVITQDVLVDPVVAADGYSYSRGSGLPEGLGLRRASRCTRAGPGCPPDPFRRWARRSDPAMRAVCSSSSRLGPRGQRRRSDPAPRPRQAAVAQERLRAECLAEASRGDEVKRHGC